MESVIENEILRQQLLVQMAVEKTRQNLKWRKIKNKTRIFYIDFDLLITNIYMVLNFNENNGQQ